MDTQTRTDRLIVESEKANLRMLEGKNQYTEISPPENFPEAKFHDVYETASLREKINKQHEISISKQKESVNNGNRQQQSARMGSAKE